MIPVFDCHADTPVVIWRKQQTIAQNDYNISLEHADALLHYAQFFAYCTYGGIQIKGFRNEDFYELPRRYMDEQLKRFSDRVAFCTSAEAVEQAWASGKAAALYSIEGAEAILCDPGRLELAREDGVRMTTLTWNADNALGGYHQGQQIGLTEQGRTFVKRAQSLGIIMDVSHCSDQTFYDMMDITEKPIVASHSNSRAVHDCSRNLTDDMYRQLCATGGLAGINLYAEFLGEGTVDFETVYRHVDHFLQLAGDDRHVGLGGDLDGCETLPQGFAHVSDYNKLSDFLLTKYDQTTVERMFYQNILDIMRRCAL